MSFHVITPARVAPRNAHRIVRQIENGEIACERFLDLNPGRRESTFIRIYWNGHCYRTACGYRSTQGTSIFDRFGEI